MAAGVADRESFLRRPLCRSRSCRPASRACGPGGDAGALAPRGRPCRAPAPPARRAPSLPLVCRLRGRRPRLGGAAYGAGAAHRAGRAAPVSGPATRHRPQLREFRSADRLRARCAGRLDRPDRSSRPAVAPRRSVPPVRRSRGFRDHRAGARTGDGSVARAGPAGGADGDGAGAVPRTGPNSETGRSETGRPGAGHRAQFRHRAPGRRGAERNFERGPERTRPRTNADQNERRPEHGGER